MEERTKGRLSRKGKRKKLYKQRWRGREKKQEKEVGGKESN